jgi:hypothetical protein
MPSGLATWKKIAPEMIPSDRAEPIVRVQGRTMRTEATISAIATARRNGFS